MSVSPWAPFGGLLAPPGANLSTFWPPFGTFWAITVPIGNISAPFVRPTAPMCSKVALARLVWSSFNTYSYRVHVLTGALPWAQLIDRWAQLKRYCNIWAQLIVRWVQLMMGAAHHRWAQLIPYSYSLKERFAPCDDCYRRCDNLQIQKKSLLHLTRA